MKLEANKFSIVVTFSDRKTPSLILFSYTDQSLTAQKHDDQSVTSQSEYFTIMQNDHVLNTISSRFICLPLFPALITMLQHWRQGVELYASRWLCIDGADNDPHVCVLLFSRNNSIHSYMISMFQININFLNEKWT